MKVVDLHMVVLIGSLLWGFPSEFLLAQSDGLENVVYRGETYTLYPVEPESGILHFPKWREGNNDSGKVLPFPKDGKWIQFFGTDRLKRAMIFTIKQGLLNGDFQLSDSFCNVVAKGSFDNGVRTGWWTINGKYRTEFLKLQMDGFDLEGSRTGAVAQVKEGSPDTRVDSMRIRFDKKGRKRQTEEYLNGMRTGISRSWYYTGQIEYEVEYREGKRSGVCRAWGTAGDLYCDQIYQDDIPIGGKYMQYNHKGELIGEGLKDRGVKMGWWTYFYPDGSKKAEGEYKVFGTVICSGGVPVDIRYSIMCGPWIYYYPDGQKLAQGVYRPSEAMPYVGHFREPEKIGVWEYWSSEGESISLAELKSSSASQAFAFPDLE